MKKSLKWIIPTVLLVALIGGATILYNNLSKGYEEKNQMQSSSSTEQARKPAPDFTAIDMSGNKVKLSDFLGKPVVINFWTSWCGYCKEEMPDFEKLSIDYPEVQFMMINPVGEVDKEEDAKAFIEENGYSFDVFYDDLYSATQNYYVTSYPTTVFVDEYGNFVGRANGMINYDTVKSVLAKM
ncbi:MAG: TlpA family protein disulfide reductase [Ruminococcaceae bacterium]|nr:TlpA family protein disulfide reductase [Oscillospiraceae bacterium]